MVYPLPPAASGMGRASPWATTAIPRGATPGHRRLIYLHRPRMTIPATFRIATWNLDRPVVRRKSRTRERLAELQRHDADVWILTETDRELELPGYTMVATRRPDLPGYSDREAYSTVQLQQRDRSHPAVACLYRNLTALCRHTSPPRSRRRAKRSFRPRGARRACERWITLRV